MNKENILFCVVGLLAGLIIGFVFANSVNQRATASAMAPAAAGMPTNSAIPPGHPDIGSSGQTGQPGSPMPAETQAVIDKAKESPKDFDAQVAAAELYYQINRFDEAITFLTAAHNLKPDDREVIVHLGNASFDGDHYEDAEKWYSDALAKKPDDVSVRTDLGLTFIFRATPNYDRAIQEFNRSLEIDPKHIQTLQNLTVAYTKKGDPAKASETLAKLTALDSSNSAISKLKAEIK